MFFFTGYDTLTYGAPMILNLKNSNSKKRLILLYFKSSRLYGK